MSFFFPRLLPLFSFRGKALGAEISKGEQKVVGSNMNRKFIQFIARGCAWPWSEPKRASVLIYTLQFIKFLLTVQLDGSGD